MSRRLARELALQALFEIDVGKIQVEQAIDHVLEEQELDSQSGEFFRQLVRGVNFNLKQIDELVSKYLIHWDLRSIANVDRNLLRLSTYEMLHCPDIPTSVSINEAVELAKIFGSDESPKFINGLLDSINKKGLPQGERV